MVRKEKNDFLIFQEVWFPNCLIGVLDNTGFHSLGPVFGTDIGDDNQQGNKGG